MAKRQKKRNTKKGATQPKGMRVALLMAQEKHQHRRLQHNASFGKSSGTGGSGSYAVGEGC